MGIKKDTEATNAFHWMDDSYTNVKIWIIMKVASRGSEPDTFGFVWIELQAIDTHPL
jgi:hypothetical protein